MKREEKEKILTMVKEGKITVEEALNLIDAIDEREKNVGRETKDTSKMDNIKQSVKKGFVKTGEVISDITTKMNNVGAKCVENIKEEFRKGKDDEIIVEEIKDDEE